MPIVGLRTAENFLAEARPKNWRQGMLLLFPNGQLPLTGLTSLMKERSVTDAEYNWFEKTADSRRLLLGADLDATGGTDTVTLDATDTAFSAFKVKKNDVLMVEQTGEYLIVASDPTVANAVSVTRAALGGPAATAVTYNAAGVNPHLLVIGSAFEENSTAPSGQSFDPLRQYNYTQIFRSTFELTGTADATELRTGPEYAESKRQTLENFGMDMERAFLFGRRSIGTRDGKPVRTTNGLTNLITNVLDPGGALTMDELEAYMLEVFRYGSNEKMLFAGNRTILAIQQAIRKNSDYNISSGEKEYGINVSRLHCPFGTLVIKSHPLLTQAAGGTTAGTAYYGHEASGFIVDMAQIKYVCLKGRDVKFQDKLELPGTDGMKAGYMAECGLELSHARTHFRLRNWVSGAKDA